MQEGGPSPFAARSGLRDTYGSWRVASEYETAALARLAGSLAAAPARGSASSIADNRWKWPSASPARASTVRGVAPHGPTAPDACSSGVRHQPLAPGLRPSGSPDGVPWRSPDDIPWLPEVPPACTSSG